MPSQPCFACCPAGVCVFVPSAARGACASALCVSLHRNAYQGWLGPAAAGGYGWLAVIYAKAIRYGDSASIWQGLVSAD